MAGYFGGSSRGISWLLLVEGEGQETEKFSVNKEPVLLLLLLALSVGDLFLIIT
jgi:hypothetical protein